MCEDDRFYLYFVALVLGAFVLIFAITVAGIVLQ